MIVNTKRISTEERNVIAKILTSFHRRIVVKTINISVASPDIATKASGATRAPSKFSADDKTDNMYTPIPKIASILFFINYLLNPYF